MSWSVQFLDERVKSALDALPVDIRARFLRIAELIESAGLQNVHEPYVKHLEGPIWEMRMKGKDGIARAAYVTTKGYRVGWCMCLLRNPTKHRAVKLRSP